MRYSPEHKRKTHEKILRAAGRQFRERGFAEAGVASIMDEAELTHGGFYAHFASKDQLIAEVIRSGFDRVTERFEEKFAHLSGEDWLREWVNRYLGDAHFQHTDRGCPMPALASDIARSGPEAREAFTALFRERMGRVVTRIDAPEAEAGRRVLAAVSQMVGAMTLARALDEPLGANIRAAAAESALATLTGRSAEQAATEEGGRS